MKAKAAAWRRRPVQVVFEDWSGVPGSSRRRLVGIGVAASLQLIALLAVLGFYWTCVFAIDLRQTRLLDLEPGPDSKEYYAGAISLLENGSYHIRIGDQGYPPRYPFLYSSLMVPLMWTTAPESHILCPFRVNQAAGLLALAGLYGYFLARKRPVGAVLAIVVLSTLPAFILFARSSTSDLVGAVWIMGCYGLAASAVHTGSRARMFVAALLLGVSVCLRVQFILFAPLVLLALHPRFSQPRMGRLKTLFTATLLFGIGLCPLVVYNRATFGSSTCTGYHFWVSGFGHFSEVFSLRYIPKQLAAWWRELTCAETTYRVANIFGPGTYYSPAFLILAAWAVGDFVRRGTRAALALTALPFILGALLYFFEDMRLFLPVVLLGVPAIALLGERCLLRRDWPFGLLPAAAFTTLLLLSVVGYPSVAGFPPVRYRWQTWELLQRRALVGVACNWRAAQLLRAATHDRGGVVFSAISPVYLNAVLGRSFAALPDSPRHDYHMSREFHFAEAELQAALDEALVGGRDIYHLSLGHNPVAMIDGKIKPPPGYHWEPMATTEEAITIFQLKKSVQNPGRSAEAPTGT
jgi:hypothetical protein